MRQVVTLLRYARREDLPREEGPELRSAVGARPARFRVGDYVVLLAPRAFPVGSRPGPGGVVVTVCSGSY